MKSAEEWLYNDSSYLPCHCGNPNRTALMFADTSLSFRYLFWGQNSACLPRTGSEHRRCEIWRGKDGDSRIYMKSTWKGRTEGKEEKRKEKEIEGKAREDMEKEG